MQSNIAFIEQKYEEQIALFEQKLKSFDEDSQKHQKLLGAQKLEIKELKENLNNICKDSKAKDQKLSQFKDDIDKAKEIMSQKDTSQDVVKQFKQMIDKRDKRIKELETQLKNKK